MILKHKGICDILSACAKRIQNVLVLFFFSTLYKSIIKICCRTERYFHSYPLVVLHPDIQKIAVFKTGCKTFEVFEVLNFSA